MTLRQRIEENLGIVLATAAITGFVSGWGVPEAIRKVAGQTTVDEYRLQRYQQSESELAACKSRESSVKEPPKRKRIAIVDNVRTVYDPVSLKRGRTNYDDIYDGLKGDQSIELVRMQTYEGWADFSMLTGAQPDVVVVHASAFYSSTNPTDEDHHLQGFLDVVAKDLPKTKVIVYSRSIANEAGEAAYAGALVRRQHDLEGRVFALSVPHGTTPNGGAKSSFLSASNISRLKTKIHIASAGM
jgi:hypothetical protein